MTLWHPDPTLIRRPAYLSLADQFARAIHDGRLQNGERLPTHRALADQLKLSVQTVSRAYEELIRRGLVSGEIGRGSFVQTQRREPEPPYLPERPGEVVDLSILKPVCEPMHLERMKEALAWLAETLPASSALSFRPNMVFPRHRAIAVEWLRLCGIDVSPQNISVTNGATAAMTVALMSVAPPAPPWRPRPSATIRWCRWRAISASTSKACPSTITASCPKRSTRPAGIPT